MKGSKCLKFVNLSPDCQSEDFIRQTFMVFFPIFSANTPKSQEMIEAAFIPTVKLIANALLGTPEADINPKDVITFLIDYTKPDINKFTASVSLNLDLFYICIKLLDEMLR